MTPASAAPGRPEGAHGRAAQRPTARPPAMIRTRAGLGDAKSPLLPGGYCDAEGVGTRELRSALLVEDIELFNGESGGGQQLDDRPSEMASASDQLLQRVESPLPAA